MNSTKHQVKELKLNGPQKIFVLMRALWSVLIWGRGVGKSTILAYEFRDCMLNMPRSKIAIVAKTILQLHTRTLPSLIQGLEMLDIHRDVHYVIGKRPPKEWPKALQEPLNYDYVISTVTGTCFQLISQTGSSGRGINVDKVLIEEGLEINKEKLDQEIGIANRGNLKRWPDYPFHHGVTIVSSMPINLEGSWLVEFAKYYDNNRYREARELLVIAICSFLDHHAEDKEGRADKWKVILELKKHLVYHQDPSGKVFYSEADVLDNLDNLGWDYVMNQRKSLPDLIFKIELCNMLMMLAGTRFYPDLAEKHTYSAADETEIMKHDFNLVNVLKQGSRLDNSIDTNRPIDIAFDYGAHINVVQTGQLSNDGKIYYLPWGSFQKTPKGLAEVIQDFLDYYQFHNWKILNYYYDHTAKNPHPNNPTFTPKDLVIDMLQKNGWIVRPIYLGRTAYHHDRYLFYQIALPGRNSKIPFLQINNDNNKYAYISMKNAGVREGRKGMEKDKRPEQKPGVNQEETTHISDAVDTLYAGQFTPRLQNMGYSFIKTVYD